MPPSEAPGTGTTAPTAADAALRAAIRSELHRIFAGPPVVHEEPPDDRDPEQLAVGPVLRTAPEPTPNAGVHKVVQHVLERMAREPGSCDRLLTRLEAHSLRRFMKRREKARIREAYQGKLSRWSAMTAVVIYDSPLLRRLGKMTDSELVQEAIKLDMQEQIAAGMRDPEATRALVDLGRTSMEEKFADGLGLLPTSDPTKPSPAKKFVDLRHEHVMGQRSVRADLDRRTRLLADLAKIELEIKALDIDATTLESSLKSTTKKQASAEERVEVTKERKQNADVFLRAEENGINVMLGKPGEAKGEGYAQRLHDCVIEAYGRAPAGIKPPPDVHELPDDEAEQSIREWIKPIRELAESDPTKPPKRDQDANPEETIARNSERLVEQLDAIDRKLDTMDVLLQADAPRPPGDLPPLSNDILLRSKQIDERLAQIRTRKRMLEEQLRRSREGYAFNLAVSARDAFQAQQDLAVQTQRVLDYRESMSEGVQFFIDDYVKRFGKQPSVNRLLEHVVRAVHAGEEIKTREKRETREYLLAIRTQRLLELTVVQARNEQQRAYIHSLTGASGASFAARKRATDRRFAQLIEDVDTARDARVHQLDPENRSFRKMQAGIESDAASRTGVVRALERAFNENMKPVFFTPGLLVVPFTTKNGVQRPEPISPKRAPVEHDVPLARVDDLPWLREQIRPKVQNFVIAQASMLRQRGMSFPAKDRLDSDLFKSFVAAYPKEYDRYLTLLDERTAGATLPMGRNEFLRDTAILQLIVEEDARLWDTIRIK